MRVLFIWPVQRSRNMTGLYLCPFKVELNFGRHHDWMNIVILNVSFQRLRNKGYGKRNSGEKQ